MNTHNIISDDLKVLVFRSDINTSLKVFRVREALLEISGIYTVDVDLEDHENVLRLECHPDITPEQVEVQVVTLGFNCSGLA